MRPPEVMNLDRLVLRKPQPRDAVDIFERYARDAEVTRFLVWQPHESVSVTERFVAGCIALWENGNAFPWVITLRSDGALLGMIELRINGSKADMGYVLARPFWGNGYASEAARGVADWVIAQPDVFRVWAVCDVENAASARVLEKAGMQFEGILRRWLVHPNLGPDPRDCRCYARVK